MEKTKQAMQMERLPEYIGKPVQVVFVDYGIERTEDGELREVLAFEGIAITGCWLPFVGIGCAVRRIIHAGRDLTNACAEVWLRLARETMALTWVLTSIVADLPIKRDWLDPATEREARELLRSGVKS